jgi:CxxC motif-containing protein (DUF1111 family)
MHCNRSRARGAFVAAFCCLFSLAHAQTDPGVRAGAPGAGGPLPGLSAEETGKFEQFREVFQDLESVAEGFGPRFNLDSCGGCHTQPAIGGSSPAANPQHAAAVRAGAQNTLPAFLPLIGPVREARRLRNVAGRRGSVVQLFTITGRSDSLGCMIAQPDFSNPNNFSFRIPTPLFGLGLVEAIPVRALFRNLRRDALRKAAFGIHGRLNTDASGAVTRFGWKAQVKTLLVFSAEAYNVEMGVTSELFPDQGETGCGVPAEFEDQPDPATGQPADIEKFTQFTRLLDQPSPALPTPSTQNGRSLFDHAGCSLCHTPSLTTGQSTTPALSAREVNLFSDLALHSMGRGLADRVGQGNAGGQEFRTAPLWGLGQRIFFLHDGRTSNLLEAIQAHASPGAEANASIAVFNRLQPEQKQDLLNFLRSL